MSTKHTPGPSALSELPVQMTHKAKAPAGRTGARGGVVPTA